MRWLLLSLLVACSGAEREPPPPETLPPSSPEPAAALAPPGAPAPSARPSIGWDHVPRDPTAAARAINRDALRVHGHALGAPEDEARHVYQGSLVAFQRAVEAEPDYLAARFNVACALSRLGRADEAVAILRELLAIDLPTFAPRVDSDPDLGPLAGTAQFAALTTLRAELALAYDDALARGVPVVHVTPREEIPAAEDDVDAHVRRTMQAGVWLDGRFVPMAPRLVSEAESLTAGLTLLAQVVDVAHHAVLSFEGEGSWSEGGGPIGAGTFVVYHAGRGAERARFVSGRDGPRYCPGILFHATEDGAAIAFTEETPSDLVERHRVVGAGAYSEAARPAILVNFQHATVLLPTWEPSGLGVTGDVARLGAGSTEAALPREHHVWAGAGERFVRWAPRDEHSDWLLTAAIGHVEWDNYRAVRPALSIVGVGPGALTVELVLSAHTGIGAIVPAEHAAYAQIGDAVYRLTASTSASAPPAALPEGIRLIPAEPHAY